MQEKKTKKEKEKKEKYRVKWSYVSTTISFPFHNLHATGISMKKENVWKKYRDIYYAKCYGRREGGGSWVKKNKSAREKN